MKFNVKIDKVISKFDNRILLKDINFSVNSPAIIWIQGENGSGKTILSSILSGKTFLRNKDFTINGDVEIYKDTVLISAINNINLFIDNISYLPQKLASSLLAIHFQDDICFPFEGNFPKYAGADNLSKDKTIIDEINDLNNNLDLWIHLKKKVGDCSYGETRRFEFACSLAAHSGIVILDEPFSGLDIFWRLKIIEYLEIISQGNNSIIVITSHSSPDIYNFKPSHVIKLADNINKDSFLAPINFVTNEFRKEHLHNQDSISLNQFELFYNSEKILNINEFHFIPNKINWIEGHNGSGKSSLLLFMAGILRNSIIKKIKINGNITGGPYDGWPLKAPMNKYNLLLQNPYKSFINKSVDIDLESTPDIIKHEISKNWGSLKRKPIRFSFGQLKFLQYLLLLADSDVILIDEPLLGVHPKLFSDVLQALDSISKTGRYVIATSENGFIDIDKYIPDTNKLNIPRR